MCVYVAPFHLQTVAPHPSSSTAPVASKDFTSSMALRSSVSAARLQSRASASASTAASTPMALAPARASRSSASLADMAWAREISMSFYSLFSVDFYIIICVCVCNLCVCVRVCV